MKQNKRYQVFSVHFHIELSDFGKIIFGLYIFASTGGYSTQTDPSRSLYADPSFSTAIFSLI